MTTPEAKRLFMQVQQDRILELEQQLSEAKELLQQALAVGAEAINIAKELLADKRAILAERTHELTSHLGDSGISQRGDAQGGHDLAAVPVLSVREQADDGGIEQALYRGEM